MKNIGFNIDSVQSNEDWLNSEDNYIPTAKFETMTYDEVVEYVIARDTDLIIKERKREILNSINPEKFVEQMAELNLTLDSNGCSSYFFENLVILELNDPDEDSLLATFILKCLRNPEMVGIYSKLIMRNPDHLGVVIDTEKKVAYVRGMYEVKKGKLRPHHKKQLTKQYQELNEVIMAINRKLEKLKLDYGCEFIPAGGVVLLPEQEIEKFVVFPKVNTEYEKSDLVYTRGVLKSFGWGIKTSMFSGVDAYYLSYKALQLLK